MSQQIDLRQVERKSFAVRFEDGLTDVYMGIVLLATGLPELLLGAFTETWQWLSAYSVVCAVGGLLTWAARRFVSTPRLGTVKLGPAGKRRLGRGALIMTASLVFSVVLVTLTYFWPAIAGEAPMFSSGAQVAALVAAWMLVLFTLSSYVLDFGRGYVIGVLFALGIGLRVLLGSPAPAVAAGVLVMLLGLGVFARFVRRNPLPVREDADVRA